MNLTIVARQMTRSGGSLLVIALLFFVLPTALQAQSLGSNPVVELANNIYQAGVAMSRPLLVFGFFLGGCMVAFGGQGAGRVLGGLLMGGCLIVGAARWYAWLPA